VDIEKLEKLAKLVQSELPNLPSWEDSFLSNPEHNVRFSNLMAISSKTLPEYSELFTSATKNVSCIRDAKSVINHLLNVIDLEKESQVLLSNSKIFDSADEKIKQAGLSYQNGDYPSSIHSLNTALELLLKDKIGIPSTITGINTSNIIELFVSYKVEPYMYLIEAKKHVLNIDNKIKHQGYVPSKIDSINGIKAMEELISKFRQINITLSKEMREKIFDKL
jgi:hypothetical protein